MKIQYQLNDPLYCVFCGRKTRAEITSNEYYLSFMMANEPAIYFNKSYCSSHNRDAIVKYSWSLTRGEASNLLLNMYNINVEWTYNNHDLIMEYSLFGKAKLWSRNKKDKIAITNYLFEIPLHKMTQPLDETLELLERLLVFS